MLLGYVMAFPLAAALAFVVLFYPVALTIRGFQAARNWRRRVKVAKLAKVAKPRIRYVPTGPRPTMDAAAQKNWEAINTIH